MRVRLTTLNINIVAVGRIRIDTKTGKTVKAFDELWFNYSL